MATLCLLRLSFLSVLTYGLQNVIFLVPFEISFSDINQFGFTIHYLQNFISSSSTFFNVQKDNITIAFIKDISSTNYIDIGFAVSANTFDNEHTIKNKDIHSFRAYLMSTNELPTIIGIESKHQLCPNGKYATFYHYDIECQWLCDHLSVYANQTNECQSISNSSFTIQITETNISKFIFIGYGSSLLIALIIGVAFVLCRYITMKVNTKSTKPALKHRKSVYFYNDTENDDTSNVENIENVENVVLSTLQSPTTQNDEIFRESTLGALENIECDEKLKKKKSIIIEEARLNQFKLMDSLDEFRKNVTNEIEKEHIQRKDKLKSEYLQTIKNVKESEMNANEKKQKMSDIEMQYNETKNNLAKQEHEQKKNKLNQYKHNIKEQLLTIKNDTKDRLNEMIQDKTQQSTVK